MTHRWLAIVLLGLVACGGADAPDPETHRSKHMEGVTNLSAEGNRCDAKIAGREESEYDTSGDQVPDVRKVFQYIGKEEERRLLMICRESDLNQDGTKDVIRQYNQEGRPVREDADRDFDGRIDAVTYFDTGEIVRQEIDSTGNGRVDTKIFFEGGEPLRAERDLKGRSTSKQWRPDRWEYYEKKRIVRMGTDLDGDGKVDRWERDDSIVDKPLVTSLGEPVLDADKQAEEEKKQAEQTKADAKKSGVKTTKSPKSTAPKNTTATTPAGK